MSLARSLAAGRVGADALALDGLAARAGGARGVVAGSADEGALRRL